MQLVKVNALPIKQSGHQIQSFECHQWGHKKANFPNKNNKKEELQSPLPTQKEALLNLNKNQPKGGVSTPNLRT